MAFRRTVYSFPPWVNVNDPNAPPVGAQPLDAAALSRIETGIKEYAESLHEVAFKLNDDEFSAHAPVNLFPASCVSHMKVAGESWPGDGIVETHRVISSVLTDADARYQYQIFKGQDSHDVRVRYAMSGSKTVWTQNTAVAVNTVRQPITPNGFFYSVQAVAGTGTTGASQPDFSTADAAGETVVDNAGANQVVWVYAGRHWSEWQSIWNAGNDGPGSGLNADLLDNRDGEDYINSVPSNFLGGGFVITGVEAAIDGGSPSQLNITAGEAFIKQADGSFRRRVVGSNSVVVALPSTTYYLDLNPNGTLSFATAHSVDANYLPLATVATNVSTEISTVTDARPLFLKTGDVEHTGRFASTPSITQTLLDATRITNNARNKYVDSGGAIVLSATPTIERGYPGQIMRLRNVGTNNITLQNDGAGGLVGSTLRLAQNNIVLQPLNSVELEWVGGTVNRWVQNHPTNNLV